MPVLRGQRERIPGGCCVSFPSFHSKLLEQVIYTCSTATLPPTHRPRSQCFGFQPSSSLKVTRDLPSWKERPQWWSHLWGLSATLDPTTCLFSSFCDYGVLTPRSLSPCFSHTPLCLQAASFSHLLQAASPRPCGFLIHSPYTFTSHLQRSFETSPPHSGLAPPTTA